MSNTNTNARPTDKNMIHHRVFSVGEFPRSTHIAEFTYADGTVRQYDGREWRIVHQTPQTS